LQLTAGGNTELTESSIGVLVKIIGNQSIGVELGLVWLALNQKRKPASTPSYLQTPTEWAKVTPSDLGAQWQMDTSAVPADADCLLLVLYSYSNKTTLGLVECHISIGMDIHYQPSLKGSTDTAMVVLELYRRGTQWKVRGLAEASAYGLAALGQKLELALDEKHPSAHEGFEGAVASRPKDWTGTAFAIGPRHLLTCAHVADKAKTIKLNSLLGSRTAQCIAMDKQHDIAVLLINEADLPHHAQICTGRSGELGESVTALGFPLSGIIGSHLQVTQGCISSMRGYREDISSLQFTAPIQPGSSGSPLLNTHGNVVGMVTSTMVEAQNMNFAVKHYLLWSILDTVGFEPTTLAESNTDVLTQPQIVKKLQSALWHISCES
jgi:hypothetical protein